MGMAATTIGVTHPFQVISHTKVAGVICFRDTYADIGYCVDGAADAETWGQLEVGGRPMVLRLV